MKIWIKSLRETKIKIGPTGRILVDDIGQCRDCFAHTSNYSMFIEWKEEVDPNELAIPNYGRMHVTFGWYHIKDQQGPEAR